MNKLEASQKTNIIEKGKKVARVGLAIGAVAMAVKETPASAHETHKAGAKHERKLTVKELTQRVENRINHGKPFSIFNGTLARQEVSDNGGMSSNSAETGGMSYPSGETSDWVNIFNPVMVDGKHPDKLFDHADIRPTDYFGSLTQDKAGKLHLKLRAWNAESMQVVPNAYSEQPTSAVAFPVGKGGVVFFADAITSLDGHPDQHGGPLQDPYGNPESVGFEYQSKK
jgi:hypothetical protein